MLLSLQELLPVWIVMGIYGLFVVLASVKAYRRNRRSIPLPPLVAPMAEPAAEHTVITGIEGHGMYRIDAVPQEVLEIIYTGMQSIVDHPQLPKENDTTRAYRQLARTVRDRIAAALKYQR